MKNNPTLLNESLQYQINHHQFPIRKVVYFKGFNQIYFLTGDIKGNIFFWNKNETTPLFEFHDTITMTDTMTDLIYEDNTYDSDNINFISSYTNGNVIHHSYNQTQKNWKMTNISSRETIGNDYFIILNKDSPSDLIGLTQKGYLYLISNRLTRLQFSNTINNLLIIQSYYLNYLDLLVVSSKNRLFFCKLNRDLGSLDVIFNENLDKDIVSLEKTDNNDLLIVNNMNGSVYYTESINNKWITI